MYRAPRHPQIIAHRGFSGLYPENTRTAIEAALRLGVDMVEVDVRLSRDGVPVLLHDASLAVTTNGRGKVADTPLADLLRLDAGSWKGAQFRDERLLTLREALTLTRDRLAINLDIKTSDAIPPTLALVRAFDMLDQVVISGCGWRTVRRVRALEPEVHVLLNGHGIIELLMRILSARGAFLLTLWQARLSAALGLNVSHHYLAHALIDQAHAHNLGVWTWTVDDPVRAARLAQLGVAAITSNWPDRILPAVRGSRRGVQFELGQPL